MEDKLGARKWLSLVLVGLFGQFAWTIENMYFNVFLYNTITTDPGYIASMVGWSAAAATVTTLLMGALSDRLGKRKALISLGYGAFPPRPSASSPRKTPPGFSPGPTPPRRPPPWWSFWTA